MLILVAAKILINISPLLLLKYALFLILTTPIHLPSGTTFLIN